MVPIYKGKGDRYACGNYRGISLLSIVGKIFGRVLINRIRAETEEVLMDEQCGFRRGRGCMDQVFVVGQVCEKYGHMEDARHLWGGRKVAVSSEELLCGK